MFFDLDIFRDAFNSMPDEERKSLCSKVLEEFQKKYYGYDNGYGINMCGIDALYGPVKGFVVNIVAENVFKENGLVPDYFEVESDGLTYLIPIKKVHSMDEVFMHSTGLHAKKESIDEILLGSIGMRSAEDNETEDAAPMLWGQQGAAALSVKDDSETTEEHSSPRRNAVTRVVLS